MSEFLSFCPRRPVKNKVFLVLLGEKLHASTALLSLIWWCSGTARRLNKVKHIVCLPVESQPQCGSWAYHMGVHLDYDDSRDNGRSWQSLWSSSYGQSAILRNIKCYI
eukprot:scaffold383905_cov38-Prasinocladus_malaysianus.AAC.1